MRERETELLLESERETEKEREGVRERGRENWIRKERKRFMETDTERGEKREANLTEKERCGRLK